LQVVMESGKINKTMQRRLQNIQDWQNIIKSGRQNDILERNMRNVFLIQLLKAWKRMMMKRMKVAEHIDEAVAVLLSSYRRVLAPGENFVTFCT
jgi:hypothetical protein